MAKKESGAPRVKGDYEIGYGKPPKGRPFKPGESGNPRGRPKSAARVASDLERLLKRLRRQPR